MGCTNAASDEILDVHEALEELSRIDERAAPVVEMRCFGGLEDEELAQAPGLSPRTVRRDRGKARPLPAHALRH